MKDSFFDRYMHLILNVLHKNVPKLPLSSAFRQGDLSHVAYRIRELTNTLVYTKAFEYKMKELGGDLFLVQDNLEEAEVYPYSSLFNRSEAIKQDIEFLSNYLKIQGYPLESASQPAANRYAEYILALPTLEKVMAHFYANTHAVLFDSGNLKGKFPAKIDHPFADKTLGIKFCYFNDIDCQGFEKLLNEIDSNYLDGKKFTPAQEEIFLDEVRVVYAQLFNHVFPEQEAWCEKNQQFLPIQIAEEPSEYERTWPSTQASNTPSSSVLHRMWEAFTVGAATSTVYTPSSPRL